ncbi:hypothetical protein JN11_04230 [Mucilaginibacter frigoritolerans]|uniref:Uncharacterized protein n=1 Tax=Mucilaginibacter frigoritolerans TaxID=652788 RepID=A0A562TQY6_9SPHI|nr:hypothetical protein JN11_04230 [Mucilaginibacter frigoritolerans]
MIRFSFFDRQPAGLGKPVYTIILTFEIHKVPSSKLLYIDLRKII